MKRTLLLLALLFLTSKATLAQVPSYVPSNGLVAWWPFNGNANDESGNGNHGTVNGATLTNDRYGSVGKAYNFNGYDNYIRVPGQSALNMLGDYSVSLWFNGNYQNLFNNGWVFIAKRDDNGNCCSPYVPFEVFIPFNSINFAAPGVAYANGGYSFACVPNTSPIVYSQWQNLIVTNYLDTLSFYVDGQFIYSTYLSSTLRSGSTSDLLIGTINRELGAEWMNGVLDDIGLWNRALDSCEIKDLYFASLGNCCQASFSSQPQNQNANTGTSASFIAQSSSANPIFQWQSDLGLGWQNLSNAGQYNGVNNDTLTVTNLSAANNNQLFRCILMSGTCSDTSATATLSVSQTNGLTTLQSEIISIYPNPATNQITILSNAARYPLSYKVYNELGQALLIGDLKASTTSIDISSLAPGNYMLVVGTKHVSFVKNK